jgi:hypothetical protein
MGLRESGNIIAEYTERQNSISFISMPIVWSPKLAARRILATMMRVDNLRFAYRWSRLFLSSPQ